MSHVVADLVLLIFAVFVILASARRGFIKAVVHYLKFVLAFVAAYWLGPRFPNVLVGYVAVFLVTLILLWVVAYFLTEVIGNVGFLNGLNTLLGALLGAVVAATLILAIASVIKHFWGDTPFYTDSVILRFFGDSALLETMKFLDLGKACFSKLAA